MSKESYDISVGYSISQVVYQKHYPLLFCEFLRIVEMTDDRLKATGTSTPLSSGAGLTGTESLIFGGTGAGIFGVAMTGTSIFGGARTETKTPISDGAGNKIAFAGLRTRENLTTPTEGSTVSLPSMPPLGLNDLPSFVRNNSSYFSLLQFVLSRNLNTQKAGWLLFNTFDGLEKGAKEERMVEMSPFSKPAIQIAHSLSLSSPFMLPSSKLLIFNLTSGTTCASTLTLLLAAVLPIACLLCGCATAARGGVLTG
nr:UDP-glycosyltransferase 74E2-like [Ipomoea batatas]